jgi:hypothetical protein
MVEATALEVEQIKTEKELLRWHIVLSLREIQTNFPTIAKSQQHTDWYAAQEMMGTLNSLLTKYTSPKYDETIDEIKNNLRKYLANGDREKYFEELNRWLKEMNRPFSYAGVYPPIDEDLYDMRTPDEKREEARFTAKTYIRYLMNKENKEAIQHLVNEALGEITHSQVSIRIGKIVDHAYLKASEKRQLVKENGHSPS